MRRIGRKGKRRGTGAAASGAGAKLKARAPLHVEIRDAPLRRKERLARMARPRPPAEGDSDDDDFLISGKAAADEEVGSSLSQALSHKILKLALDIDDEDVAAPRRNSVASGPGGSDFVYGAGGDADGEADARAESNSAGEAGEADFSSVPGGDDAGGEDLAELILAKLKDVDFQQDHAEDAHTSENTASSVPADLQEIYRTVGLFLSKYRSGRIPKAFKIVPRLKHWEEVLQLTNPETWSPHAMREATKLFSSNLTSALVQRFYSSVLLPAAREDIAEHKKLNVHYFAALKQASFKPAAFFKGIIFPLVAPASDATQRELTIFGAVVSAASFPPLHTGAAVIRLARTAPAEWSSGVSYFIAALLQKKAALPLSTLEALVAHFAGFADAPGPLPVVWHSCLLTFLQLYKADLTADQGRRLHTVVRAHVHKSITPDIRLELRHAALRHGGPEAFMRDD